MVWAAPVFVAVYLHVLERDITAVLGLAALAFVAGVIFYEVLNVPVADGVVIDLTEPLDLAIENVRIIIWLITENIRVALEIVIGTVRDLIDSIVAVTTAIAVAVTPRTWGEHR